MLVLKRLLTTFPGYKGGVGRRMCLGYPLDVQLYLLTSKHRYEDIFVFV